MKQFTAFVRKEFYHILRDKRSMLILLAMPVIMIVLFGFALSTEVRNINVGILTPEPDNAVNQIIEKLGASEYFTVKKYLSSPDEIDHEFKTSELDMVIAFGDNFSRELFRSEGARMQLVIDAANANMAQNYMSYTSSIVSRYYQEIIPGGAGQTVRINSLLLFNPQMQSAYNFVPGIMGLIMMLICAMMIAVAIVREKETGTMEVLLVSPVKPLTIILAKMVPYFAISCVNLATILLLSVLVLDVPVAGNVIMLIILSFIYITTTLALGLLVSSIAKQQVVAMLISGMVLMMPTMLLSGMAFPIESMPAILQYISMILPPTWYIAAVRKLMIEGLPMIYALKETLILCGMAIVLIAISLKQFNNRLE